MTFIDLFSGIGGFRLALEKKGLKCVFSSEIEKNARKTYYHNFKEIPHGDITKIEAKEIPKHDILCAGFPCQPFSIAGKRKSYLDKKGILFYEILRIANYHKTPILILENVKGLLYSLQGRFIKYLISELEKTGYKVYPYLLNASLYGIPQNRERIYFVCIRNNSNIKYQKPQPTYEKIYLKDILEKEIPDNLYCNKPYEITNDLMKLTKEGLYPIRVGSIDGKKNTQGYRVHSFNGHAITLVHCCWGGKEGVYLSGNRIRILSMIEFLRIMGFPDNFIIDKKTLKGRMLLGNSVIPKMIETIYDNIS